MLVTLIPLFNENLMVAAYSMFTQKKNYFLSPELWGTGVYDGATEVAGLKIIQAMGVETLAEDSEVFVPIGNASLFANIQEQCDAPHERLVLLIDDTVTPEDMYVNRLRELKEDGYKLAIRKLQVAKFEEYRKILQLMDYVLLDHKKIDISKAKI